MVRFILPALLFLLICFSAEAASWTLVKYENRDHVTLDNIADFYGFTTRTVSSKSLLLRNQKNSLRGEIGSKELYINNIKFILSYPVVEFNGRVIVSRMDLSKVIEPALRPSRIRGAENIRTVILDAGHGGHDNGARGRWGNEKDFTLDVANRARILLTQMGYDVKMTRSSDVFIPLEERAAFANRYSNALFISIHFNSSDNPLATGIETFTLAPRGVPSTAQDGPRVSDYQLCPGNVRDAENMALAMAMHSSMLNKLRLTDRGIKRARFVVIRNIKIPGVLLEGGFVSSMQDSRMIAAPAYRQMMASSIVDAVKNYRASVAGAPGRLIGERVMNTSPSETGSPKILLQQNN